MKKGLLFKLIGGLITVAGFLYDMKKEDFEYEELKEDIKKEIMSEISKEI
jgi:hypothetical protein